MSFFVLLYFCCKDSVVENESVKISIETVKPEDSKKLVDYLLTQIDTVQIENIEAKSSAKLVNQDCYFDQSTQTDDFLSDIEDLEGYNWNHETKIAEIVHNDHWSLNIKRGGCDDFEMSASFMYDGILDIEKDKKQIFDKVIWITSLLKDFDGKDIKRVIEEDKVSITKRDEFNYHANFMDEKLYELYYFNFNNEGRTNFEIGYYYN